MLAGFLLIALFLLSSVVCEEFEHKFYMDPAFAATTACHAMHQIHTGLRLYIRPLDGRQLCPGLDALRARSPHEHNGLDWADNLFRV